MDLSSIAFTLLAFAVALGPLIFVHELGHFAVAKRVGVRVLRFSIGFGPILFSRTKGDTEYALSALPLGGYVKMLGEDDETDADAQADPERAFHRQVLVRRSAIVFAGPAMNLVFAFVAYATLFLAVGVQVPSKAPRAGGVSSGLPAEQAGLRAGDTVVAIDDQPIDTWDQLSETVRASGGKALRLTIDRDGARFPLVVTPSLQDARTNMGEPAAQVYRIGIENSLDWERVGPVRAVAMGAQQTVFMTGQVLKGLGLMLTGHVPLREIGGPIAIAKAAGQQARAGARYYVMTLAFLSINLGVINLMPVPGLDGGLLAIFGVEALMRRPLRPRHREIAQQVGLLMIITLMVFVFYNDIHRLLQG